MRKLVVMLLAAPTLTLALTVGLLAPTAHAAAPATAPAGQTPASHPAAHSAERGFAASAERRKHRKRVNRMGLSARDMRVWNRLARCEASGRWFINTGNGYYGGLQISPGTWAGYGGKRFASNAHRASKFEQVRIGQKIRRGQGWGAWPSCSRKLGLR